MLLLYIVGTYVYNFLKPLLNTEDTLATSRHVGIDDVLYNKYLFYQNCFDTKTELKEVPIV